MEKVGLPSVGGMKDSLVSYAVGAGGGLLFGLSNALFGSGLIGGLAGAAIAGSMIKGVRGETIATMLGFQTGLAMIGSGSSKAENTSTAIV